MNLRDGMGSFSQAVDEFGGITPTIVTLELTPTPVRRPLVISEDTGIDLPEPTKRTIIEWSLPGALVGPGAHRQPPATPRPIGVTSDGASGMAKVFSE